jgi:hypothetical protein
MTVRISLYVALIQFFMTLWVMFKCYMMWFRDGCLLCVLCSVG